MNKFYSQEIPLLLINNWLVYFFRFSQCRSVDVGNFRRAIPPE